MRRIQTCLLALTLLAVAWGCGEVSPDPRYAIVVSITSKSYYPGDTVLLRMRNISKHDVGFNLDSLSLEVLKDGVWTISTSQPSASDIIYPLITTMVPRGETDSASLVLRSNIPAGTYRLLVMPAGLNDDGRPIRALYTPTFAVIAES